MKKILGPVILGCSFILILFGIILSFKEGSINTFHGKLITVDTLLLLSPKIPQNLEHDLTQWLSDEKNKELLDALLKRHRYSDRAQAHELNNQLLKNYDIVNLSASNYSFVLPNNPNYIIKISGPITRCNSLLAHFKLSKYAYEGPDAAMSKEQLDNLVEGAESISTYQHISRMAYWLLLKQFPSHSIILTDEMYLYHVPGKPFRLTDENYIIVEKAMPQGIRLEKFLHEDGHLSAQALHALITTIIRGGLWNLNNNIDVVERGKTADLEIYDLEQPDNTPPATFFHKDQWRFNSNMNAGFEELKKIVSEQNLSEKYYTIIRNWLKEYAHKSPSFKESTHYHSIEKMFNLEKD